MRGAAFSVLVLLAVCAAGALASVRGAHPKLHGAYSGASAFHCLDGSATLDADQVNDDYCDCADGSDEPGTSACSNGRFYCSNKGFRPQMLPSSRVNDGVCDCCDGSDEYSLVVQCANTCVEDGREAREAARLAHDLQTKGYNIKLDYAEEGQALRDAHHASVSELQDAVNTLSEDCERLEKVKSEAEAHETKAKSAFDTQWEDTLSKRVEEAKRSFFNLLDVNSDGVLTTEDLRQHAALDTNDDGAVDEEEALSRLDADGDGQLNATESSLDFDAFCVDLFDELSGLFENVEGYTAPPTDADKPDYDEDIKALISTADEARAAHKAASSEKRSKEAELEDVQKKLQLDLGPKLEFAKLLDQCFEYIDREYKYKVCVFDKVTQEPKNGGRATKLGVWGHWAAEGGNAHAYMKYENGEKCWNGPNRSMAVKLVCGAENEVDTVAEPNRCEYSMTLRTPAACSEPPAEPADPFVHDEL